MDKTKQFILWFNQLGIEDVPFVGGKNASLGEMYRHLTPKGINIPNGFAITAHAYHYLLKSAGIDSRIKETLSDLDTRNMRNLAQRGHKVRELIKSTEIPKELQNELFAAYEKLCKQYGEDTDVAVRSSATAEDLPDASFAGQQETYLNIKGKHALLEACKKCFASLFTNRAISYRVDKGFDHFAVGLSIGIQKMVRSDLAGSGVMFSIDTESGFKNVVFITAAYGLGENVVQGAVNPDEYYVFKPTLKQGYKPILSKKLGEKAVKMIYDLHGNKNTINVQVDAVDRMRYVLSNEDILTLARWACTIEDHYSKKAGTYKPMDMEWAKDGSTNQLFIVQARPETVHSQKARNVYERYNLKEKGKVLVTGSSVGDKIGKGKATIIKNVSEIGRFKKGQVLITDMTDPDWEPVMKIASAIVTNRGGRTCFTGDTKIVTNKGFRTMHEVYQGYEDFSVPSLNRKTLKIEWKPVIAAMKRKAPVIEINSSISGRMEHNGLRLTPDHKMLTYQGNELIAKEISQIIHDGEMLLLAQHIPTVYESSSSEQNLAYLLGAIATDGHIYQEKNHGEVTFIQKKTKEKEQFINEVMAYRCYSKSIAQEMKLEEESLVETLLWSDEQVSLSFLGGVIDGDGCFKDNRIHIYISKESLIQSVVVSLLRLGVVPQITGNRNIYHVQIVENIEKILSYTHRVKGVSNRNNSARFFSARQLLKNLPVNRQLKLRRDNNLLISPKDLPDDFHRIVHSDTRMVRTSLSKDLGEQEVYNITVQDNHNYIVFSDRYTPIIVNNCHAAIISRELGIPCMVGTDNGTDVIKQGQGVTVDCSQGETGFVYDGQLKFDIERMNLDEVPKTKTKIMMNVGNPERAFDLSFLPNQGVGLARQEFIINNYIKVHPLAIINFHKLKDESLKEEIESLTKGYPDKASFYVSKLAHGVAMIGAAFYPHDVIVRLSDFRSNEYADLVGGRLYEPTERNPMIGWRGASRYYDDKYREAFGLECKALSLVRDLMGLTNVKIMIPFCRTVDEGKKVLAEMEKYGLKRGKNGLEVYVMCEIPSNVILADLFADIFDGFSIGSNDLTQLTLGLDRDSELVAHIFDERNEAVRRLIKQVITVAKQKKRKIGICGDAPSSFPEIAEFLVDCEIDSISLSPDAVIKTTLTIAAEEKKRKKK